MDKIINDKLSTYTVNMKTEFNKLYDTMDIQCMNQEESKSLIYQMINFMDGVSAIEFTPADLSKRKRVKNIVPHYDRCIAKIAGSGQCTRKKRLTHELCGTHLKGTPHGLLHDTNDAPKTKKITVTAHDIKGIYYYLDDDGNVYNTSDVTQGKPNPRVVAKYAKNDNGMIHIPEFNL